MEKGLFRKLILVLIFVMILVMGILGLRTAIRNKQRIIVEKYEKCLVENFNQRSDCARDVSNYTYKYLDQLRKSFK